MFFITLHDENTDEKLEVEVHYRTHPAEPDVGLDAEQPEVTGTFAFTPLGLIKVSLTTEWDDWIFERLCDDLERYG